MKTIDILIFIFISIPFFKMVIFDQEKLNTKRLFFIYLIIGISSWAIGFIYFNLSQSEDKWFVYFGSQMTLNFLILFNLVAIPYRKLQGKNPEISEAPSKAFDIIPTTIVVMGTILIPLFLDTYFIKLVIK